LSNLSAGIAVNHP